MEKESLLNYLYRFFDIIVLLFIVFDFGYDFEENYNSPHVIGLILLSIGLLTFNAFKFFTYKYKKTGLVETDAELLMGRTEELLEEMKELVLETEPIQNN